MEQKKPISINSLPSELLDQILGFLVQPPPSLKRLYDQPFHEITHSTMLTLKSCSCVSQRWRRAVLPILFQNARMLLCMDTVQSSWPTQVPDFLTFVRRNNCQSKIESFTLVVQDPQPIRYNYDDLEGSLDSLKDQWQLLFNVIDPFRITIVAPPPVLGALAALRLNLRDVDEFHMPYHILSLERAPSLTGAPHPRRLTQNGTTLLNLCPWESLLLNEGSFIRPYSTSNYHNHINEPPSVLPGLVTEERLVTEDSPLKSLLPKTIKSVAYIAMFPSAHHTAFLNAFLPQLQHLYIQLTPRHDPYPDTLQQGFADMDTMTVERLWVFKHLLEVVLSRSALFPDLMEIECGETEDKSSWQTYAQAEISYSNQNRPDRWVMDAQREGVVVRRATR